MPLKAPDRTCHITRSRCHAVLLLACLVVYSHLLQPVVSLADGGNSSKRVLLLSIDGMHAMDLARFVRNNPNSALAGLLQNAVNYTTASCAKPADSFPGMMAIATG